MATYALPELRVIENVQAQIATLSISERRRVLMWLNDYFSDEKIVAEVVVADEPVANDVVEDVIDDEIVIESQDDDFSGADADDSSVVVEVEEVAAPIASFAEFYALIAPKTSIQKVMCAAYWLQEKEGLDTWRASDITRCLKSAGERARFLSNTLSIEAKRDDPRVLTLEKGGESMQARKTFALSNAGEMWVEDRMGDATL